MTVHTTKSIPLVIYDCIEVKAKTMPKSQVYGLLSDQKSHLF